MPSIFNLSFINSSGDLFSNENLNAIPDIRKRIGIRHVLTIANRAQKESILFIFGIKNTNGAQDINEIPKW